MPSLDPADLDDPGGAPPPGAAPPDGDPVAVQRLSRRGLVARLAGTALVLAVLVVGQVQDTNDLFPFGTLSQFSNARSMDGDVRSILLLADTDERRRVHVPLNMNVVGVGRAEVEGQLPRIRDDPQLMQAFIDAYATLNPEKPPLRTVYLVRKVQPLEKGYVSGDPTFSDLIRWDSTTRSGG